MSHFWTFNPPDTFALVVTAPSSGSGGPFVGFSRPWLNGSYGTYPGTSAPASRCPVSDAKMTGHEAPPPSSETPHWRSEFQLCRALSTSVQLLIIPIFPAALVVIAASCSVCLAGTIMVCFDPFGYLLNSSLYPVNDSLC